MASITLSADGLNLNLEEYAEETIVHCSGQITKKAADWFRTEIRDRVIPVTRGNRIATTCRIVLNLSGVSYVDSDGLGAILGVWTDGQKSCCTVEITNHGIIPLAGHTGIGRFFRKLKHGFMQNSLERSFPLNARMPQGSRILSDH